MGGESCCGHEVGRDVVLAWWAVGAAPSRWGLVGSLDGRLVLATTGHSASTSLRCRVIATWIACGGLPSSCRRPGHFLLLAQEKVTTEMVAMPKRTAPRMTRLPSVGRKARVRVTGTPQSQGQEQKSTAKAKARLRFKSSSRRRVAV